MRRDLIWAMRRLEAFLINGLAVPVVPRRRIRLVQRQPLLRLFDAVVVKLVIDPSCAQRFQQIAPDLFRELARVNDHVGDG